MKNSNIIIGIGIVGLAYYLFKQSQPQDPLISGTQAPSPEGLAFQKIISDQNNFELASADRGAVTLPSLEFIGG